MQAAESHATILWYASQHAWHILHIVAFEKPHFNMGEMQETLVYLNLGAH